MPGASVKVDTQVDGAKVIRVVLADDHAVVRKGIREFLEEEGDVRVEAETTTGVEAVALTLKYRPDVAVLDIQMPELSGVEAARQIKAKVPEVRVLVLTAYDDDPYIFAMLQAGASGYVLKNSPQELDIQIEATRTALELAELKIEYAIPLKDAGEAL